MLFKNQQRGPRIQKNEEQFGLGMNYTDAPLKTGFVKELLNYDYKEKGEVIAPRPGLRNSLTQIYAGAVAFDTTMVLSDGKYCAEVDQNIYSQIILGLPTANLLSGTSLVTGQAYVGTGISTALTLAELSVPAVVGPPAVNAKLALFRSPSEASIHGISVDNLKYIAQQIGTFAYNDDYYFFRTPGDLCRTKFSAGAYSSEVVTPRTLTPKEAVTWGYNMLQTAPYTFTDTNSAGDIQLLGLLPYTAGGALIMSPQPNQDVVLRAYYSVLTGKKYDIEWAWKEYGAPSWITLATDTVTFNSGVTQLTKNFSAPVTNVMIRVTATQWSGGVPLTYPDQVLTVGISFDKESYGTTANVSPTTYSLYTASGMCFWKGSLILYGVKEDPTILFKSEINDPSYFPYPNNGEIFDEPIIHALPFLDNLLVFTSTKLHMLTLKPDGLTWTKQTIQNNLNIKPWDIHLIQAVKNMVFFKSGNYFYMVVPMRTSGGLSIAPISKPIESFLDNFSENIAQTLRTVYSYGESLTLLHYYNYLDFEDVCNVYVFETLGGLYINYVLLYNTVTRSWRTHLYESQSILKPFQQDATQKGTMISLLKYNNKPSVQYLQYDKTLYSDYYVPQGRTSLTGAEAAFLALHTFKNYQLLDSGSRDIESDLKKRFREVQFKFHNVSQQNLKFYSELSIDGEIRRDPYQYYTTHDVDPMSLTYGLLTVDRVLINPVELPGETVLASTEEDLAYWQLEVSQFPELIFWKVRITMSGKGYTPKLKLISYNTEHYEILNFSWIYRPLYSR